MLLAGRCEGGYLYDQYSPQDLPATASARGGGFHDDLYDEGRAGARWGSPGRGASLSFKLPPFFVIENDV